MNPNIDQARTYINSFPVESLYKWVDHFLAEEVNSGNAVVCQKLIDKEPCSDVEILGLSFAILYYQFYNAFGK